MTPGPRLPEALETWVQTTVRTSGLPLHEREEVAGELRAHFEDALAAGKSVDELLVRFGDPAGAAQKIREARVDAPSARKRRWKGRMTMSGGEMLRELKRAVRTLVREPGFALIVILTLALGVGANTAVFTVLDAVMLKPLPYAEPDRLVRIYDVWHEEPTELNDYLRGPGVVEYMKWDEVFEGVGALYTYREMGVDLTSGPVPERLVVSRVSPGYFDVLGVPPMIGRGFLMEESIRPDEGDGGPPGVPVTVLSHALWQRLFEGDRDVLGRTVEMDGRSYEVVGVLPRGFKNPMGSEADLWVPQDLGPTGSNNWGNHYLTGIARLKAGLTIEAAQDRANALNDRIAEIEPENEGWQLALRPLHSDLVGERSARMIWILAAAVGLILLSACVNVANIVFARSLGRERDVALRGALGSGRGRLVVHLLSESVVLAVIGSLVGLALGTLGIRGLLALAPDALPTLATPELSSRVFIAGMASAVFALLAFGLAPALRMARTAPAEVLRSGGRSGTDGRALRRLRGGLVVAQVAVAVVLVAGAGLLLRSFSALQSVDLAIDDRDVLTYEVHLPLTRYAEGQQRHDLHLALQERVSALPEVEATGATSWLPVNGRYHSWTMAWLGGGWDGVTEPQSQTWIGTDVRMVVGDYFASLDIALLRGLEFVPQDPEGEAQVWVNHELASHPDLAGADILGEVIWIANAPRRVVGIVENAPHEPRGALSPKAYIPHAQYSSNRNWAMAQTVKARPGTDLGRLREQIRAELSRIDPQLVVYRARPLSDLLSAARAEDRFATTLMTIFAVLALTLAGVGAYGVLAGNVARRRREFGIRMALGADPQQVLTTVMRSAFRLSLGGVAVGLGLAWIASRWLQTLLFEVDATDPWVFAGGAVLLVALGTLAGWLPARRATRVDPAVSLSSE